MFYLVSISVTSVQILESNYPHMLWSPPAVLYFCITFLSFLAPSEGIRGLGSLGVILWGPRSGPVLVEIFQSGSRVVDGLPVHGGAVARVTPARQGLTAPRLNTNVSVVDRENTPAADGDYQSTPPPPPLLILWPNAEDGGRHFATC